MKDDTRQTGGQDSQNFDSKDRVDNNLSLHERLLFQLARSLTQGQIDYGFTTLLDPTDPQPALVCFVNYKMFRRHFHSAWTRIQVVSATLRRSG